MIFKIARNYFLFLLAMVFITAQNTYAEAVYSIENFRQAINFGDWKKTRILCDEILLRDSDDVDALLARAQLEYLVGRTASALVDYQRVLSKNPKDAFALFARGSIFYDNGKRQEGQRDLKLFLSLTGASSDLTVLLDRAKAFSRLNNHDAAQKAYRKVLDATTTSTSSAEQLLRGFALIELSSIKDAQVILSKLSKAYPSAPIVLRTLAYCHSETGSYKLALTEFAKVAELSPDFVSNQCGWGWALQKQKHYDEAILHYNRAIKIDAKCLYALMHRGNCYLSKQDFSRALNDFIEVIVIDPGNTNCILDRAGAYASLNRHTKAIEDCKRVLAIDTKNAEAWGRLGFSKAKLGKWKEAYSASNLALKLSPNSISNLCTRAESESKMKLCDQAADDFAMALRIDPKSDSTYYFRGVSLLSERKYVQSITDFSKAIDINAKNAAYFSHRAFARLNIAEYQRAIEDCTESLALNPKQDLAYLVRGEARLRKGNFQLALTDLSACINENPMCPEAFAQRAKLYSKLNEPKLSALDQVKFKQLKIVESGESKCFP